MKKVVIDVRLSGLKHAGIGRYTEMLIQHFGKFEIRSANWWTKFEIITVNPNIRHYTLAEQVKMLRILDREKPDLVHFPHFNVPLFYNRPFVVTIHDLLWHEQVGFEATTQSKWKYLIKYMGYRMVMKHALSKAKAIVVPSNWVKKQVIKRFPEVGSKVVVIYEGVVQCFKTLNQDRINWEAVRRFDLKLRNYLIYVGSLYPHKNWKIILDILPQFPELKLAVACARNVFWKRFREEIEKRGLKNKVILAGFIPDDELVGLYQGALAFVFPSKSEGFGLPGLEAMAAGCPVISSNAGSLPVIYGNGAVYFSPEDGEELIEKIREIRDNQGYREELIKKGKERAGRFSWEKCAEETAKVYESCLSLRPGK